MWDDLRKEVCEEKLEVKDGRDKHSSGSFKDAGIVDGNTRQKQNVPHISIDLLLSHYLLFIRAAQWRRYCNC